jgi:hypothetical protein
MRPVLRVKFCRGDFTQEPSLGRHGLDGRDAGKTGRACDEAAN